ncbi:hypothetical protein R3P38DRAFT_2803650 [Favolaschia claudopus]|uniref:Uncharacterized protein n=1 Tax=Favolaschia claudopus TaxID=2862362 RepID=A0AAV9ZJK6_9AGAR
MPSDTHTPPNSPPAYNDADIPATVNLGSHTVYANSTANDSDSDSSMPDLVPFDTDDEVVYNNDLRRNNRPTPGSVQAITHRMNTLAIAPRTATGRDLVPAEAFYRFPNRLVRRALEDAMASNDHVTRVRNNVRHANYGGRRGRGPEHARLVHDQIVRDLIGQLQRAEHVLQGFLDDHNRYYPRHR